MKKLIFLYLLILSSFSLYSQFSTGGYLQINDSLENDGFINLNWNRKFIYTDRTRYNCYGGRQSIRGRWKLSNDTLICKSEFYFEEEVVDYESFSIPYSDSIVFIIKNEKKEPLENVQIQYYRNSSFKTTYNSDANGLVIFNKSILTDLPIENSRYKNSASLSISYTFKNGNIASVSSSLSLDKNKIIITVNENPKEERIQRTTYFKKEENKLMFLKTLYSSDTNIEKFEYWKGKTFQKNHSKETY